MKTNLAIIFVLCVLLLGCNSESKSSAQPPLPQGWSMLAGKASISTSGNFTFGQPGYVGTPASRMQIGQTITLKFKIEGKADLYPVDRSMNQPGDPARVRLFIWQGGDNLSCAGDYRHYRIWSSATVIITAPGEFELSSKIDPALWTDCYGGNLTPARFNQVLSGAYAVGFTFGGSDAGHGVAAQNGTASFKLISYEIN